MLYISKAVGHRFGNVFFRKKLQSLKLLVLYLLSGTAIAVAWNGSLFRKKKTPKKQQI